MSIREIEDSLKENKVVFGLKSLFKHMKSKKDKPKRVFVAKDTRHETLARLKNEKIEYDVLKRKEDMARDLKLNFHSEVIFLL
jgi:ribosomal protein L7Ae-like RNA K-turn-binding protein